jgi:heme-degrading monooxygenase HmoA
MWINMTFAKMTPAYEKDGLPVLYSQKNMKRMTGAKGFIAGYALLKQGDHTMGCSLSIWESREDAEAWFASKEYATMVNEVAHFIAEKPDRQGYDSVWDMKEVAQGKKKK